MAGSAVQMCTWMHNTHRQDGAPEGKAVLDLAGLDNQRGLTVLGC